MTMSSDQFTLKLRATPKGFVALLRREQLRTGIEAEGLAKRNVTGGSPLRSRTGRLRGAIAAAQSDDGLEIRLRAGGHAPASTLSGRVEACEGGTVRYARIQELGGTIRAKGGGMLRIPLPGGPALTGAGVDRYGGPLRDTAPEKIFRLQISGGKAYLVHDVGRQYKNGKWSRGARTEFWYILKHSVTLPARPYLKPALETAAQAMGARLTKALRTALDGAAT